MRVSKYLFCAKCDRKTSLMAAKLTVIGHICQISPIVNKVFDVLLHMTIWDFSSNTHLKIRTENQNNRLWRHKCSSMLFTDTSLHVWMVDLLSPSKAK